MPDGKMFRSLAAALGLAFFAGSAGAATADDVSDFLAGTTIDCPGCDLAGAQINHRAMAGANLAGATVGSKLYYEDDPPLHSSDNRPVRITYAVVTEGELAKSDVSNLSAIVPLDVAVTYIILFSLYGAVLEYSGAGRFFLDISLAATGQRRTGPGRTTAMAGFLLGTVFDAAGRGEPGLEIVALELCDQLAVSDLIAAAHLEGLDLGGDLLRGAAD